MNAQRLRILGFISFLVMLGLAIVIVLAWASPQSHGVSTLPTNSTVNTAPDFRVDLYQGESLGQGSTWRLSNHMGNAVLVNFWAVSCATCRAEMPSLERVYQRFKDRGLIVIGVDVGAAGANENRQAGSKFLRELGISFSAGSPASVQVVPDYQVIGIPTSVLVRPGGKIYARWGGVLDESKVAKLVEEVLVRP